MNYSTLWFNDVELFNIFDLLPYWVQQPWFVIWIVVWYRLGRFNSLAEWIILSLICPSLLIAHFELTENTQTTKTGNIQKTGLTQILNAHCLIFCILAKGLISQRSKVGCKTINALCPTLCLQNWYSKLQHKAQKMANFWA